MKQQRRGDGYRIFLAGAAAVLAWSLAAAPAAGQSLELKRTIVLKKGKKGKLDHLVVDSKSQRLFLANKVNNTVDVVDLKAGKLLHQIKGQAGAQGLAYAPDLGRLFVALGTGGYCNIFDGKNYKLLKTVKFTDDADNVRYHPGTHLVYVAHAEKALGVIDGKTFDLKADIELPGTAEGFQLDTRRPRLYLCIPSPSQVVVIDTGKNKVVKSYPVKKAGGLHPLAVDEANRRLFIGGRKKPRMVVMDSETGKEVAAVDIPGDVDDLFFDARRKLIYASCGEGFLAVIKQRGPNKYQLLEKIPTVKDARTCFFDPKKRRLYLAVPRQPGKKGPEIRVYQAR
jgi:DNA-binding beta-propeller fold protein YncE